MLEQDERETQGVQEMECDSEMHGDEAGNGVAPQAQAAAERTSAARDLVRVRTSLMARGAPVDAKTSVPQLRALLFDVGLATHDDFPDTVLWKKDGG